MYPDQLIKYIDIILKSNVTMALEHFGLPVFNDNKNISQWHSILKEIEQGQNTFIKLSGLDLNNDNNQIARCLDIVFSTINSNKLCYGSNYPLSNKNHPLLWQASLIKHINNDQLILNNVFVNTANNLYNLSI
jgi:predicted TIM-barrel fold metal-dependent hydrolase